MTIALCETILGIV